MKCPVCKKIYKPVLERKLPEEKIQNEFSNAPAWQREQLISGVCSDECWDKLFANTPDEDFPSGKQF